MQRIAFLIFALGTTATLLAPSLASAEEPKARRRPLPFRISKETTYFTAPLTASGTVDYEQLQHKVLRTPIPAEQNVLAGLVDAVAFPAHSTERMDRIHKELGLPPFRPAKHRFLTFDDFVDNQFDDPARRKELKDLISNVVDFFDYPCDVIYWTKPLPAKLTKPLDNWEKLTADDFPRIQAALKRPHYFDPSIARNVEELGKENLSAVGLKYKLAIALHLHARLMFVKGKYELAEEDIAAQFRLALAGEGMPDLYLMRGAADSLIEWIAAGEMTAERARRWQGRLDELMRVSPNIDACRRKRAFWLGQLQAEAIQWNEEARLSNLFHRDLFEPVFNARLLAKNLRLVDWNDAMRYLNKYYDRYEEIDRIADYGKRIAALEDLEKSYERHVCQFPTLRGALFQIAAGKSPRDYFARYMLHSTLRSVPHDTPSANRIEAEKEHEAVRRMIQLGLAIGVYRHENGALPKTAEALVPKYLAKIPADPHGGKPLCYHLDDGEFALYSVGLDGQDHGGARVFDTGPLIYSPDDLSIGKIFKVSK